MRELAGLKTVYYSDGQQVQAAGAELKKENFGYWDFIIAFMLLAHRIQLGGAFAVELKQNARSAKLIRMTISLC